MTIKDQIDSIWLYSRYYGNMVSTAQRLYDDEEGYAAVVILLNATELIFKSLRENYSDNFNRDIVALADENISSLRFAYTSSHLRLPSPLLRLFVVALLVESVRTIFATKAIFRLPMKKLTSRFSAKKTAALLKKTRRLFD